MYVFIYLFWLLWVLVVTRGIVAVACGLLSCGMHAVSSSPIRDGTRVPGIGNAESYPLDHQGGPYKCVLKTRWSKQSEKYLLKCNVSLKQKLRDGDL